MYMCNPERNFTPLKYGECRILNYVVKVRLI